MAKLTDPVYPLLGSPQSDDLLMVVDVHDNTESSAGTTKKVTVGSLPGGGSGTVTSVSVASANGFAGTVATPTTTPAITVKTSVTGLLKGNGTAVSAATAGTDYAPATSGAAILKGNGSGGFSSATAGSDYLAPNGSGAALTGITANQVGALPSSDDLSAIAAANATAGNVAMNSHKLTGLANGSASTDSAAFGQIPTALPPNGSAGGDLSGTYPGPTVAKVNGAAVPVSKTIVGTNGSGQLVDASSATLANNTSGNAATATNLAGGATLPAYLAPKAFALTDGASIAVDASAGNYLTVTLGGNRTIAAPSNAIAGEIITFALAQDATGSRTVTWTSGAGGYSFGTDGTPTLTTTANAVDEIAFRYHAGLGKWLCQGWKLGFS
jgi:hypothetical protein